MSECKIIEELYMSDLEARINEYLKEGYTLFNCRCADNYYYAVLVR